VAPYGRSRFCRDKDMNVTKLQVKKRCLLMLKLCVCAAFGFGVFGATTCMLDNVRGKDKALTNGLIAGFCGGFCAGTRGTCCRWK